MELLRQNIGRILVASMFVSLAGILFFGLNLAKTLQTKTYVPPATLSSESSGKVLELPSLKPKEQYELIARRNIFSLGESTKKAAVPETPKGPVETPLNLKLKGTAVSPGGLALAMIEDPSQRREDLYIVGDKIQDAQIIRILPNQVILQRSGREESLSLFAEGSSKAVGKPPQPSQQAQPPRPAGPTSQAKLPGAPSPEPSSGRGGQQTVQTLMAKLRLRPHFAEGKPSGFVVGEVPQGSVFQAAGLKVGDIVVGINDEEVRTPNQLLKAYKEVSQAGELWLEVLRDGQEETIEVEVEAILSQK